MKAIRLISGLSFLFLASLSAAWGAESKMEGGWTTLPLVTNGKVDPAWGHTGYGGMIVEDGTLRTDCDPRGLGLLVYKKEKFGNCQLRIVFKCENTNSNSGVYVRLADGILDELGKTGPAFDRDATGTPSKASMEKVMAEAEKDAGPWYAVHHGYEVQIAEGGDLFHRTGSIYSLAPATGGSKKKPGEWKTMIITLTGTKIFVDLDGKRITSFDSASPNLPPRKQWHEPKREPKRPEVGYFGLQNHDPGDLVWFKEVSVRSMPAGAKIRG